MTAGAAHRDGVLETPGPLLRIVKRQELAFAIVGGFNTALGMALTLLWLAILGDGRPGLAVVAAYAVSMVVAFVGHRTLVFRVRGRVLRDFLAFCGVNAGGLVLNVVLVELAVTGLGFPAAPASMVVMGLVAVLSFFGHRYISFRRRPATGAVATAG
ncbi:GtrA family protein [Nocardia mangyaensis]|uniref:GtrA family protein n=1 Tax=Nocardia mangyaensis TaxID=2213200 RepID=UPI002674E7DD|nr:GtrA family protein [Nocardia mangyaensis]MDO3649284.1 GtrA family protein [Nocardia mangyaensis]